jgi:hypothetical protein
MLPPTLMYLYRDLLAVADYTATFDALRNSSCAGGALFKYHSIPDDIWQGQSTGRKDYLRTYHTYVFGDVDRLIVVVSVLSNVGLTSTYVISPILKPFCWK